MLIKTKNVSIRGVYAALPNNEIDLSADSPHFSNKEIKKTLNMIGTKKVFRATDKQTTSDLCFSAAEHLLRDMGWEKESVDAIILVTQTPDFILPSTSCILQSKLGLSPKCIAFDISLGCSGYIYGMYIVSQLIQSGAIKRALLLVGDTISKMVSPSDRSVSLLFGDAGTATAMEYCPNAESISFSLGTDGNGAQHLIVPSGGYRQPRDDTSNHRLLQEDGHIRSMEDLFMNGTEVFNFTTETVPVLLKEITDYCAWEEEDVDFYLLHQANRFMLDFLRRKSGISSEKLLINIEKFGNTSSASIPLLLCDFGDVFSKDEKRNIVLCGFGVGLSWGAAALSIDNLTTSIIYV
ncbi:ketoacyl-ACP synthase III [Paenibacillus agri]|uniref:Ketoacyl-ACP synthase III n=1 Tax=Paenibacillus agri TaxID=2744309 RepID=A0A850EMF5_9BACL|nr:ketoacyl-ACP synthase III [Paenibacillus agri]NUU60940.1 ketoacyl-ACP synthase III [Paenibacillus agri]